jgi:hypothetical protein
VKITADQDDVRGFEQLKGSKRIPPTGAARSLKGKTDHKGRQVYAFPVGRVEMPNLRESVYLDEVLDRINVKVFAPVRQGQPYSVPTPVRESVDFLCRRITDMAQAKLPDQFSDTYESNFVCRSTVNEALDTIEEFANKGVYFTDNHSGNWGRHKDRLVAIDLGLSAPPWDSGPPAVKALAMLSPNRVRRPMKLTPRWPRWRR